MFSSEEPAFINLGISLVNRSRSSLGILAIVVQISAN
jgi:hypothetical protein